MLGIKRYVTVIMDGSDKKVNEKVIKLLDAATRRRIGKSKCRKLDSNHPTMMVVKRLTTRGRYIKAKLNIQKHYPGLCIFDVTV